MKRTFWAVRLNTGTRKRSVLPLSLQKTGRVTVGKPSAPPRPVMVRSCSPRSTFAPSCCTAPRVARMSWENSRFPIWLVPAASAAQSTARCAALLLGGTAAVPHRRPGWITAFTGGLRHISRPIAWAIRRHFSMVSAKRSGLRHWAPSLQAHWGLSWTSISRPSAPAATAAMAMLWTYL